MTAIRPGTPADLDAVAAIQRASAGAAHWEPAGYLAYDFRVAVADGRVAGFLVARSVAPGEWELLNLAVDPACLRRGTGHLLMDSLIHPPPVTVFLEVRLSNEVARKFYENIGFQEIVRRPGYYDSPPEAAIVMKFHSCYVGG
jgi:ribosomal-protein-alanine N-acetyltransferase